MTISSIPSGSNVPQPVQSSSEASEPKKAGPDHDGDADDGGAKAAASQASSSPSVNLMGQLVGQMVNTKA